MTRASLAALITLGLLPACQTPDQPASPSPTYGPESGGNCRPDIGPGGILKINPLPPNGKKQAVEIMKIAGSTGGTDMGDGKGKTTSLDDRIKYILEVNFDNSTATLKKGDDSPVSFDVPIIKLPFSLMNEEHRVLLVDNVAGGVDGRKSNEVFKDSNLLLVFSDAGGGLANVAMVSFKKK